MYNDAHNPLSLTCNIYTTMFVKLCKGNNPLKKKEVIKKKFKKCVRSEKLLLKKSFDKGLCFALMNEWKLMVITGLVSHI